MIHELVDQVNAVLDGEIVAFDAEGKNSFEALQQRMNLANEREIERIAKADPRRAGRLRPAVAGRSRHDGADAGGAARAARADRGGGPPAPGDDPRRGRREVRSRAAAKALRPRGRRRQEDRARSTCPAGAPTRGGRSSSRTRRTAWSSGLTPGPGRARRDVRRAARRRARRRRVEVDRPGRLGVHRQRCSPSVLEQLDGLVRDEPADRDPTSAAVKGADLRRAALVCARSATSR